MHSSYVLYELDNALPSRAWPSQSPWVPNPRGPNAEERELGEGVVLKQPLREMHIGTRVVSRNLT